jgi:RNA polymerase sigma-70 factor (ECF subfamily)
MQALHSQPLQPIASPNTEPPPRSGQFPVPPPPREIGTVTDLVRPALVEVREGISETIPALQRRARYLARSTSEAEDLVADTVERALRFASGYRAGSNLRAWLMQIMYSVFASRCRRAQRERMAHQTLGGDPTAWSASNVETADNRAVFDGFVEKLRALPERYAEVLWLVDYQEYAYSEAAEVLGVPLGTVMSRLHRARRLMRASLDPQQTMG